VRFSLGFKSKDRPIKYDTEPYPFMTLSPRTEQTIRRQILRKLLRYFAAEQAGDPYMVPESFDSNRKECRPSTSEWALSMHKLTSKYTEHA
jgi:capsid portal protein